MFINRTLLELSPELLTQIFMYLALEDRKNVRLASSDCYEACNRVCITRNEKLVLRSGYCIQEITKILLSCKLIHLNLEFQGLPVDTFPASIWKTCGNKIYALHFHQCTLSSKAVKNIITFCQNLEYWKIWINPDSDYYRRKPIFDSFKPFDDLTQNKIIRRNLIGFEIYINGECMWSYIFKKVFEIFPNIKSFSVSCWCSGDVLNYLEPEWYPTFSFTRIDKCIKSTVIEKLRFDIPTDGHWLKNFSLKPSVRLKEIRTTLVYPEKIFDSVLTFFSCQKELETVHLTINELTERLIKKLIFHILKECPKLEEFRFCYPPFFTLNLNYKEFLLLLKSRLKVLKLRFNVHDAATPIHALDLPLNNNLQSLIIDSHFTSENDYVVILKHFLNLRHLELCFVTDVVLQAIFQYQTNLLVLKLNHIDNCTDYGFTEKMMYEELDRIQPVKNSIRRLQKLESFEINGWSSEKLTEATVAEFVFPNLKYFRFAVDLNNYKDRLTSIASNSPLLEVVIFDLIDLSFNTLVEFCKNLKKLYHLDCSEAELNEMELIDLFNYCPSLRFISFDEETYCYNPFTKKVYVKPSSYFEIQNKYSYEMY